MANTVTINSADCLADYLVVELRPFAVGVIVYGTILTNSEVSCRLNSVNVGAEEQKLPAVL